ncbi:hypothetical protein LCGC14_0864970 [marine sediment metagenome]|uniref:Uncharacterized protein n=1 Tax=marine sediment metagenome TaxID=412755 RepID=A0A0F9P6C7_9ZZZZ
MQEDSQYNGREETSGPGTASGYRQCDNEMKKELLKYIKPGEFTFCSRCGSMCRRGSETFMCVRCRCSIFSREKVTELEKQIILAEQSLEQSMSDLCKAHRKDLAVLRQGV